MMSFAFAAALLLAALLIFGASTYRYFDDDACNTYVRGAGQETPRPSGYNRQNVTLVPPAVTCERREDPAGSYTLGPAAPIRFLVLALVGAAAVALLTGVVGLFLEHRRLTRQLDAAT